MDIVKSRHSYTRPAVKAAPRLPAPVVPKRSSQRSIDGMAVGGKETLARQGLSVRYYGRAVLRALIYTEVSPEMSLSEALQLVESEALVHHSSEQAQRKVSRWREVFVSRLAYVAACAVFILGTGVVIQGMILNSQVNEQVGVLQAQSDDSAVTTSANQLPSSEPPENSNYIQDYQVAASLPRTISIPSIGVHARVLQVGVDKNNSMMTPATAYDTAWYNGSSRPGEMGAMIINGHVLGDNGRSAIFTKVDKLVAGAKIIIEKGNGEKVTYAVQEVETVATEDVDMASMLVSANTALPGLNLITCAGQYTASENSFDKRVLVSAVQLAE